MARIALLGLSLLSAAMLAAPVDAADRLILGRKFLVRDPTGAEPDRVAVVLAKETATDVPAIAGDPMADGATLRVITNGANPSDKFYGLYDSWSATSTGFVFRNMADGDPIRRVILKRSPSGVALLKVVMKGNVGTRDLDVVPPNPGTSGTIVLSIHNGGDRFCASYGGAAGGTVAKDTATVFKIRNPNAQPPCPPDPPQLCCDFGPLQQCGWATDAEQCLFFGGNPGDGNSECDSVTGLCAAPPPSNGPCCGGFTTIFGGMCAAGPGIVPICGALGGTLDPSAVCTPSGCSSPSGAFVDSGVDPF
jgi:hypothetical protein